MGTETINEQVDGVVGRSRCIPGSKLNIFLALQYRVPNDEILAGVGEKGTDDIETHCENLSSLGQRAKMKLVFTNGSGPVTAILFRQDLGSPRFLYS